MEFVPISEFIHLSGFSATEVCALLEDGLVKTSIGKQGEVLIDLGSVPESTLGFRASVKQSEVSPDILAAFDEHISASLLHLLDEIVEEAVELAVSWIANDKKDE